MRRCWGWIVLLGCCAVPSYGWGNHGHEMVAYLAYIHATSDVQARIDQLVSLNPCYKEWQKTVDQDKKVTDALDKRAAIFMLAATWPDFIKNGPTETHPYDCQPGFSFSNNDRGKTPTGGLSADVPPQVPEASQNVGYTDTRRHQYWHFIDTPFTTDKTTLVPPLTPNIETELDLLSKSLATKNDANLNSYDLVWITHLMGDLHQPLHDTERYSKALPNGDQGGNAELICSSDGKCNEKLHAHWDGLPGAADSAPHLVIADAKKLDTMHGTASTVQADFAAWGNDSFEMAKKDAYAKPFNTGAVKVQESDMATAKYDDQAKKDMQSQIVLAGWRLAQVLNTALKNRPDSCCKVTG